MKSQLTYFESLIIPTDFWRKTFVYRKHRIVVRFDESDKRDFSEAK